MDRATLAPYSGMLPGLIAGHYEVRESHIDLPALCARAGVDFVQEEAVALDLEGRRVLTAQGETHDFDLLSIDTGSTPPLDAIEGARRHAIPVKPVEAFLATIEQRLPRLRRDPGQGFAVIGAGAAGFEVVLALEHRIRDAGTKFRLVAETPQILPGFPAGVRRHAERRLREQGVEVRTGARVCAVDDSGIVLANGEHLAARHVVVVTGAAPAAMYRSSGLATDAGGFVAVHSSLRSCSHPFVFASGDAAAVLEHPRPKAGVFAVRQGPPLTRNLRRALQHRPLVPFVPQRQALALISTGRRHAIASRDGFVVAGDWVWRWKDWIDRRFVARFNPS